MKTLLEIIDTTGEPDILTAIIDRKMQGEQLKAYRLSLGLNQEEFRELIGVSRIATVSDYEAGKRKIPRPIQIIIELRKQLAPQ